MDIRMAVTDLDGTLLRGDKSLSTYTLRMIERVRAYGILFVVATARPIRTVKSISGCGLTPEFSTTAPWFMTVRRASAKRG